jgi:hypothetical protein
MRTQKRKPVTNHSLIHCKICLYASTCGINHNIDTLPCQKFNFEEDSFYDH